MLSSNTPSNPTRSKAMPTRLRTILSKPLASRSRADSLWQPTSWSNSLPPLRFTLMDW